MLIQAEGARLLPVISRVTVRVDGLQGIIPCGKARTPADAPDGHIVLCLRHCGAAVIVLMRDMYMHKVLWVNAITCN